MHVLSVGNFGRAVADRLASGPSPAIVTRVDGSGAADSASWPVAEVRVLCAWRPVPALARLLDELAFAWGVPWLPVIVEHPDLVVGPFVIPGEGACHGCLRRRFAQHSLSADIVSALHDRYEADPALGPGGFMPFHVRLAAAMILEMLDRREAGRVVQVGLVTQRLRAGTVVGVHGCRRCRSPRDESTRSYARLGPELEPLLRAGQGSA